MIIADIDCSKCKQVIDWAGKCKCERPYEPMTNSEYTAHFIHPFMRRNNKNFNGQDRSSKRNN